MDNSMSAIDDLNQSIDDINSRLDDNDNSLQDFSDNLDSNLTDVQSQLDDHQTNIDDLNQNSGQLTFPLSQDTIDLISEQGPAINRWLYNNGYIGLANLSGSGRATVYNPLFTTKSVILLSVYSPQGTRGDLAYDSSTPGQITIISSSTTDTSTVIYFILVP